MHTSWRSLLTVISLSLPPLRAGVSSSMFWFGDIVSLTIRTGWPCAKLLLIWCIQVHKPVSHQPSRRYLPSLTGMESAISLASVRMHRTSEGNGVLSMSSTNTSHWSQNLSAICKDPERWPDQSHFFKGRILRFREMDWQVQDHRGSGGAKARTRVISLLVSCRSQYTLTQSHQQHACFCH